MAPSCVAKLRAAARGRAALEEHLATSEWDPEEFTPADHEALDGDWSWLGVIAGEAERTGHDGMVDDELAYVAPFGFDPGRAGAPILLVHGDEDRVAPRSHADWLARHCPSAQLWPRPGDGHISVLSAGVAALDWLRAHARGGP
jgi:pimeloyl-ACP methyl ester carboxylesterase